MHCAIRCPSCLLTIYTIYLDDGTKGLTVRSLPADDLEYYNCPFALCDYHFDINHDVNLYWTSMSEYKRNPCPGFSIAQRTFQTKPFRSRSQTAGLEVTLDTTHDELKMPTMLAYVGDRAQAAKIAGEEDKEGDAAAPAVPHAKNRSTRGQRWTTAEVEKLTRLANESCGHDEIAKEMDRSISAVKNKIAAMRDKGELPVHANPLKRKRDVAGLAGPPSSVPDRGGSMGRM